MVDFRRPGHIKINTGLHYFAIDPWVAYSEVLYSIMRCTPTGRVTTTHQSSHCSQLVGYSSNVVLGEAEWSHLSNEHQL